MWSPASSCQEDVLPPSTSRFSISSTSMPASSSLTAVARPASPPPTMIVFGIMLYRFPCSPVIDTTCAVGGLMAGLEAFALQDSVLVGCVQRQSRRTQPTKGNFAGGFTAPNPHRVSRVLDSAAYVTRRSHKQI